jgi:Tol biopolymer transport system component
VFSSNREGSGTNPPDQLYVMAGRRRGSRRLTDVKDSLGAFEFTGDGKWLVYAVGKSAERQLWALPAATLDSAAPKQLTKHSTPIRSFEISRDGSRLYFIAPDTVDKDNATRREKKFTVNIRNEEQPVEHLWVLDLATLEEKRLTSGSEYTVSNVSLSRDGKWIGFRGTPNDRYKRNVTEASIYGDAYLVEAATGRVERLTTNAEAGESPVSFSPDGSMLAISAPNDWTYFRDDKIYVRPTASSGAAWTKLGRELRRRPQRGLVVRRRQDHLLARGGQGDQPGGGRLGGKRGSPSRHDVKGTLFVEPG